jgi:hypothetical protein
MNALPRDKGWPTPIVPPIRVGDRLEKYRKKRSRAEKLLDEFLRRLPDMSFQAAWMVSSSLMARTYRYPYRRQALTPVTRT